MSTATKSGGRWVTITKEDSPLRGRHIFIDDSGNITKGKGIPSHVIHHLNSKAGKHHLDGAEDHEPDHMKRAEQHARRSGDIMGFGERMSNDPDALAAVKASGKKLSDIWKEHGGKEAAQEPEYQPDNPKKMDDVKLGTPRVKPQDVTIRDHKKTGSTAYMSADSGGDITIGDPDWVKQAAQDNPKGLEHVLTHEVGHVLSNAHPELERHIMDNPEGALGRVNNKAGRFEGVSHSPEESWAEAYATYHTDPEWLKKNHPKTFDFVERMLSKIPNHGEYLQKAKQELDKYLGKGQAAAGGDASDPLERAKKAAADHPNARSWLEHLQKNDKDGLKALAAHGKEIGTTNGEELFKKLNPQAAAKHEAEQQEKQKQQKQAAKEQKRAAEEKKLGHKLPDELDEGAEKAIRKNEASIMNQKHETGFIHSPDGKQVWANQGGVDYVDVSDARDKGVLRGNVLTHNHPQGNSFSHQDVNGLLAWGLKEMRAVSSKHLHRIQPPEHWPKDGSVSQAMLDNMASQIKHIEEGIRSEFWDRIGNGKMTKEEAAAQHFHELWTRAAKEIGFKYSREEHGGKLQ